MRVRDEIRKTVVFLGYENQQDKGFTPVGSAFFLGHDPKEGSDSSPKMWLVTARHIIDSLRAKGVTHVVVRMNSKAGEGPFLHVQIPIQEWISHPTDKSIDVAIFEIGIPADADHLVLPMSLCATKNRQAEHEVELGEEVFISGLFRHHIGSQRNIPIVRVGNLAASNEERVITRSFGQINAYLIEARSIGGLSGSPVFLNLGIVRKIAGETKFSTGDHSLVLLLGLIHGHFDEQGASGLGMTPETVNAGIAIVVPIESVLSVIFEYEKTKKPLLQTTKK